MTFEEAMGRLVELARQSGGTVRASQVEADPDLSTDHDTVERFSFLECAEEPNAVRQG